MEALEGVSFFPYDPRDPIPGEHYDATVLVAWGNSDNHLKHAASHLHSLQWVQTLAAGADSVLGAGFGEGVIVSSGRSLHNLPVAEHALALVLAAARRLHTVIRAQIGHRWAEEVGGVQPEHNPDVFTTLRGARVLIWGFGGIARTITPHLLALGATVVGVGRSKRVESGFAIVSNDELADELPRADVLLMILPATGETYHALNAERIALLQPRAWVINVGRGSTINEQALMQALKEKRIGGAALDVTEIEPLPVSSELWDQANLIITPHAAGGRPLGASELVRENLDRFKSSRKLLNLIER